MDLRIRDTSRRRIESPGNRQTGFDPIKSVALGRGNGLDLVAMALLCVRPPPPLLPDPFMKSGFRLGSTSPADEYDDVLARSMDFLVRLQGPTWF